MFKPSRRALGVATAFTLSAVVLAPAASAGLLNSSGGGGALPVPALSGLLAPVQNLLGGSGGLGGSSGLGGLTNLGGVTNLGGLTSLGGLTNLGGLPAIEGIGLPGLSGASGADGAGGQLLNGALQSVGATTLACNAAAPQLLKAFAGGVAGSLCEFNPLDGGIVGLLSSL